MNIEPTQPTRKGPAEWFAGDVYIDAVKPTDAIIKIAGTSVCGSDLWPYRGIEPLDGPTPMGHEYAGACGTSSRASSPVCSRPPARRRAGHRDEPPRAPAEAGA